MFETISASTASLSTSAIDFQDLECQKIERADNYVRHMNLEIELKELGKRTIDRR